jgi:hypothetical protein
MANLPHILMGSGAARGALPARHRSSNAVLVTLPAA